MDKNVNDTIAPEKVSLTASNATSSGSNVPSPPSTSNGTKSFQDSIKAFSNGLKELLSLPPVYTPPSPIAPVSTPTPSSPKIPKKLIATLIQKEQYFNKILSETKYTDAILINHAGEEIRGFRCFLAHISPVFQAIFDSKEDQLPVRIEVGVFKLETLKQITQFSQGAEFEVNENVMELLKFAKKFSINLLIVS
uniref:BTB domain-containing protein n=1 Tax=Panagrolaimus superbus TaxID=310955 RepID=A0A914ZDG9_9BILA